MLETLFESGAAGGRPRAGALVSVAAHAAIIAAAVVATTRAAPVVARPERITIVPLGTPARPPTPEWPRPVASSRTSGAPVAAAPIPPVSIDWARIPTGLPSVEAPPLSIGE